MIASYYVSTIIIDIVRRKIFKREEISINARTKILRSLKFILFSVVFLIIAAFIEVFVTPVIGGLVIYMLCLSK